MTTYSNHKVVYELMQACLVNGVKHIVISPGSRNAPLILSFAKNKKIKCYSIVDERVAGFFALGLAKQLQQPVALSCTSGTAVLNYAPAVAEAYEQNIPLVVLSADRPKELIDQAEGQSIRQENILHNIVAQSYQLPSGNDDKQIAYARRLSAEALSICRQMQQPIHINIPLWEPLYHTYDYDESFYKPIYASKIEHYLEKQEIKRLASKLAIGDKVLVVVGFMPANSLLNEQLEELVKHKNIVVLAESISNLKSKEFYYTIDRLLSAMHNEEVFSPDILITLGGTLISKMLKKWLRCCQIREHWHLNTKSHFVDTFQHLTENIMLSPTTFLGQILPYWQQHNSQYAKAWKGLAKNAEQKHFEYVKKLPWCDFQAFEILLKNIPDKSLLHLGNSTVIRYHQLFSYNSKVNYASNRGTSGIDGCTSTAVGAAYGFDGFTTLITGDIALGYDSNALWHKYVSPKLRLIVINNGGGGIFRFLEASSKQEELEEFFETTHSNQSYEHLAKHWGISYISVENRKALEDVLQEFYSGNTPKLLEIKTPQYKNAEVLRGYFEYLKNENN